MAAPRLSIVVAFHDMAREAARTLATLAPGYQRGVAADAYEVIAVDVRWCGRTGRPSGCCGARGPGRRPPRSTRRCGHRGPMR